MGGEGGGKEWQRARFRPGFFIPGSGPFNKQVFLCGAQTRPARPYLALPDLCPICGLTNFFFFLFKPYNVQIQAHNVAQIPNQSKS